MKFSSAALSAVFLLGCSYSNSNNCNAFSPAMQSSATTSTTALYSTSEETTTAPKRKGSPDGGMSQKKEDRLGFMKNPQYHRRGFKDVRPQIEATMESQYKADLVEDLKSSGNYMVEKEGVKMYLAKDFGFCWGVERSIALAYEAVEHYPDRKLHITNELIHNPEVNDSLTEMKVNLIEKEESTGIKDFSKIEEGDVVILPAFGASYEEMDMLDKKVSSKLQATKATCNLIIII